MDGPGGSRGHGKEGMKKKLYTREHLATWSVSERSGAAGAEGRGRSWELPLGRPAQIGSAAPATAATVAPSAPGATAAATVFGPDPHGDDTLGTVAGAHGSGGAQPAVAAAGTHDGRPAKRSRVAAANAAPGVEVLDPPAAKGSKHVRFAANPVVAPAAAGGEGGGGGGGGVGAPSRLALLLAGAAADTTAGGANPRARAGAGRGGTGRTSDDDGGNSSSSYSESGSGSGSDLEDGEGSSSGDEEGEEGGGELGSSDGDSADGDSGSLEGGYSSEEEEHEQQGPMDVRSLIRAAVTAAGGGGSRGVAQAAWGPGAGAGLGDGGGGIRGGGMGSRGGGEADDERDGDEGSEGEEEDGDDSDGTDTEGRAVRARGKKARADAAGEDAGAGDGGGGGHGQGRGRWGFFRTRKDQPRPSRMFLEEGQQPMYWLGPQAVLATEGEYWEARLAAGSVLSALEDEQLSLAQLLLRNRRGDRTSLAAAPDPLDPLRGRGALAVWLEMDQEGEEAVGAEGPPGSGSGSGRGPGAVLRSSRALTAGAALPRELPPPSAIGEAVVGLAGVSNGGGGGAGRGAGGVGQVVKARAARAAVEALRGPGLPAAGGGGQNCSTNAAAAGVAAVVRNADRAAGTAGPGGVEAAGVARREQQANMDQGSAQQQAVPEAEAQATEVRGLLCGGSRLHAAAAAQAAAAAAVSALAECRTAAGASGAGDSWGSGEGGVAHRRGAAGHGGRAVAVGGCSAAAVGGWHVWIGEDPKPYVGRREAAAAGAAVAADDELQGGKGAGQGPAARSEPAAGAGAGALGYGSEGHVGPAAGVDAGGPGAAGAGGEAPDLGGSGGQLRHGGLRALVPCNLPGNLPLAASLPLPPTPLVQNTGAKHSTSWSRHPPLAAPGQRAAAALWLLPEGPPPPSWTCRARVVRRDSTGQTSTEVCGTVNGSARESSDDEPMDAYSNHLNHHNRRRRPLDPVSRPCSCCCRRCGVRRHDGPAGLLGQLVAQALRQHDPCTVTPQQVYDAMEAICSTPASAAGCGNTHTPSRTSNTDNIGAGSSASGVAGSEGPEGVRLPPAFTLHEVATEAFILIAQQAASRLLLTHLPPPPLPPLQEDSPTAPAAAAPAGVGGLAHTHVGAEPGTTGAAALPLPGLSMQGGAYGNLYGEGVMVVVPEPEPTLEEYCRMSKPEARHVVRLLQEAAAGDTDEEEQDEQQHHHQLAAVARKAHPGRASSPSAPDSAAAAAAGAAGADRSSGTGPGGSSSSSGGGGSGAGMLRRLAALAGTDVEAGGDLQLPLAVRRLQAAVRDWATDPMTSVGVRRDGQGQEQGAGGGRVRAVEQLGDRAGGEQGEEERAGAGAVGAGGRRVGVEAGKAAAAAAAAAESASHLAMGLLRRLEWPLDVDVSPNELQQQLLDAAVGEEGGGGRAAEGAAEGAAAGAASPSHGTEHVARRRRELLGVLEKAFRQSCTKLAPLMSPGGTAHVSTAPPPPAHGPGPSARPHGSLGEAQDEQRPQQQQEQAEEQLSRLSFAGRAELRPPLELCGPDVRLPDVDRDQEHPLGLPYLVSERAKRRRLSPEALVPLEALRRVLREREREQQQQQQQQQQQEGGLEEVPGSKQWLVRCLGQQLHPEGERFGGPGGGVWVGAGLHQQQQQQQQQAVVVAPAGLGLWGSTEQQQQQDGEEGRKRKDGGGSGEGVGEGGNADGAGRCSSGLLVACPVNLLAPELLLLHQHHRAAQGEADVRRAAAGAGSEAGGGVTVRPSAAVRPMAHRRPLPRCTVTSVLDYCCYRAPVDEGQLPVYKDRLRPFLEGQHDQQQGHQQGSGEVQWPPVRPRVRGGDMWERQEAWQQQDAMRGRRLSRGLQRRSRKAAEAAEAAAGPGPNSAGGRGGGQGANKTWEAWSGAGRGQGASRGRGGLRAAGESGAGAGAGPSSWGAGAESGGVREGHGGAAAGLPAQVQMLFELARVMGVRGDVVERAAGRYARVTAGSLGAGA